MANLLFFADRALCPEERYLRSADFYSFIFRGRTFAWRGVARMCSIIRRKSIVLDCILSSLRRAMANCACNPARHKTSTLTYTLSPVKKVFPAAPLFACPDVRETACRFVSGGSLPSRADCSKRSSALGACTESFISGSCPPGN